MGYLKDAIDKIRDRSSIYWAFYYPAELGDVETVEVRLNGTSEFASEFDPPNGWVLHRIQWSDTFFIRRRQAMNESEIEKMLLEMLRFADEKGMQFHSWDAGPTIALDDFQL
jgi:hypothetical protein